jgi:hypothetical protein
MEARGIQIIKHRLIIPSTCVHLGAENIGLKHFDSAAAKITDEIWVCRCMIQEKKPKTCAASWCPKGELGIV